MIDPISMARIIKEVGLSIGVFILCAWMVVFMVKKLSTSIDGLITRTEEHNKGSAERGRYIREEHKSMLTSLKEVEKALGRINGYRDNQ